MKKLLWLLIILPFFSCHHRYIRGNGDVTTQSRDVSNFHGIKLEGSMDVSLIKSDKEEVEVEAEQNLQSYIETYVRDGILIVKMKDDISFHDHSGIHVKVSCPKINSLTVAASGSIEGEGKFASDDEMDLEILASGNLKLDLDAPSVKVSVVASGNAELSGETKNIEISSTASGNIDASKLKAENAKVNITASGEVHVYASVKLDATIMGSGNIGYKGGAAVTKNIMGSGEVSKED
ncbi:MAG: hypothetical protein C5B52_16420 [Bacteroidetes bacterium]|nr:MAG: hypothetical protein C5B52_16420 [Bacteroidota bacterium]